MNGQNVTLTSRDARGSDRLGHDQNIKTSKHSFKKNCVRGNECVLFFVGTIRAKEKNQEVNKVSKTESNKEKV